MSVEAISSSAVNAPHVSQQAKLDQPTSVVQAHQNVQKVDQKQVTDTVTISKQAAQKLAGDGDSADREIKENAAEKASEALRGKK